MSCAVVLGHFTAEEGRLLHREGNKNCKEPPSCCSKYPHTRQKMKRSCLACNHGYIDEYREKPYNVQKECWIFSFFFLRIYALVMQSSTQQECSKSYNTLQAIFSEGTFENKAKKKLNKPSSSSCPLDDSCFCNLTTAQSLTPSDP